MANEVKIKMTADDLASKKIKGVGKSAQTATDKIRGMRGSFLAMGAAGGAILGALGIATKTFAQTGDEIQKMSLRTALTTEVLSEYRFALEQSGSSIEGFEKSIRRMSSFIQDGRDGLTTTTDALDTLGVAVKDLEGLGVEDAFVFLSSALADVEDDITQAALAQDLFGRSGTALLPLLAQGADGIAALREEAQDLGIVFDQDMANSAARLIDAQNTMAKSVEGLQIAFAQHLAPALSSVLETIGGAVGAFSTWADENPVLSKTIVILAGALGTLLIVGGLVGLMIPTMAFAYGGLTTAVLAAAAAKAVFTVSLWANVAAWIAFHAATGGIFLAIAAAIAGVVLGAIWLVKNIDKVRDAFRDLYNKSVPILQMFLTYVLDFFNAFIKGFNAVGKHFGLTINEMAVELPKWEKAIENVADNTKDYFELTQTGFKKTAKIVKEETKEMTEALDEASKTMLMTHEQSAEDIVRRVESKYARLKKERWANVKDEMAAGEELEKIAEEEVKTEREIWDEKRALFRWQADFQRDLRRQQLNDALEEAAAAEAAEQALIEGNLAEFQRLREVVMNLPGIISSSLGSGLASVADQAGGTATAMGVLSSLGSGAGFNAYRAEKYGLSRTGDITTTSITGKEVRILPVNMTVNMNGDMLGSEMDSHIAKAMQEAAEKGAVMDLETETGNMWTNSPWQK